MLMHLILLIISIQLSILSNIIGNLCGKYVADEIGHVFLAYFAYELPVKSLDMEAEVKIIFFLELFKCYDIFCKGCL